MTQNEGFTVYPYFDMGRNLEIALYKDPSSDEPDFSSTFRVTELIEEFIDTYANEDGEITDADPVDWAYQIIDDLRDAANHLASVIDCEA